MPQRGPVEDASRFALNLDRVTISRRAVESAISCVQSFVRKLLFTQRDFFTFSCCLVSDVNVASSVYEDSVYDTWNSLLPEGYDAAVRVLEKAYNIVAVRWKDARDTCERWYEVTSVDSSVVGDSTASLR